MRPIGALMLAAALLLARAGSATAAPPGAARCTLRVVHAMPGEGGIDAKITRLRPYLQRPPYDHWHSFKLFSESEQEFLPGASASYPLPNGKAATVTYTRHDLAPGGKHRVRGVFH